MGRSTLIYLYLPIQYLLMCRMAEQICESIQPTLVNKTILFTYTCQHNTYRCEGWLKKISEIICLLLSIGQYYLLVLAGTMLTDVQIN